MALSKVQCLYLLKCLVLDLQESGVHRQWYMPEDYFQGIFDAISLAVVHADMM